MPEFLFPIYKAAQALILPPTSLLLVALVCVAFARRRRWAAWLGGFSIAVLMVLATPVVGNWLLAGIEAVHAPVNLAQLKSRDAKSTLIVVLGAGRQLGAREVPGGEDVSPTSLQRSRYGATLARQTGLPIAVSAGKPDGGVQSEAALMRAFLESEMRQPVAFVEEYSRDTWENANFTARLLKGTGIRRVVLVTDASHMRRAVRAFRAQNLRVDPAPTGYVTRPGATSLRSFVPSVTGLWMTNVAIREFLGDLVYRLRS